MIRGGIWALGLVGFMVPVFIGALGGREELQHTIPEEVEGISSTVLSAYVRSASRLEEDYTGCTGMTWPVLAGIGKVESNHAQGSDVSASGRVDPPVLGPRLDGSGAGGNTTPHYDSDHGEWDGDTEYDRAVGPMQFIPTTWAAHGLDGNGDGSADPHNIFDAAWSAAVYLCLNNSEAEIVDFEETEDLQKALMRYNQSSAYVEDVMSHIGEYQEIALRAEQESMEMGTGEGSEKGREAAQWALAQVGKPYVWGGAGPHAFDCSGLTMQAWAAAGVDLPRVTTSQVNIGATVTPSQLEPGDLLFYDTGGPGGAPAHVTMYVGDGQMVNAPSSGQNIRVEPVNSEYYQARFMAAKRPG